MRVCMREKNACSVVSQFSHSFLTVSHSFLTVFLNVDLIMYNACAAEEFKEAHNDLITQTRVPLHKNAFHAHMLSLEHGQQITEHDPVVFANLAVLLGVVIFAARAW